MLPLPQETPAISCDCVSDTARGMLVLSMHHQVEVDVSQSSWAKIQKSHTKQHAFTMNLYPEAE